MSSGLTRPPLAMRLLPSSLSHTALAEVTTDFRVTNAYGRDRHVPQPLLSISPLDCPFLLVLLVIARFPTILLCLCLLLAGPRPHVAGLYWRSSRLDSRPFSLFIVCFLPRSSHPFPMALFSSLCPGVFLWAVFLYTKFQHQIPWYENINHVSCGKVVSGSPF